MGNVGEVTVFFFCLYFRLTVSLGCDCDPFVFLTPNSQFNCGVLHTFSFSEKRGAGRALLLCEQSKRARMNLEGPLFKVVPDLSRKVLLTKQCQNVCPPTDPPGARASVHRQDGKILGESEKSWWKSESWSNSCLVREMKLSVSFAENARDEGRYSRDTP